MKWKALQMPKEIRREESADPARYGKFVLEAFECGWGVTVGNAMRRVLLSSLQGAAVVSIRIDGVSHEFSTIPGVAEDVTDIVLNIKQLRVKLLSDAPETLRLDVNGNGEVTAAAIEANQNVEILNPDLHIATLSGDASLSIEMKVADGRGYVIADDLREEDAPLGTIFLDANFSPVTKVAFHVSDTRVGQHTDFNRLELEVWTDGSITPEDAMAYAAKLLVDHFE
ncbi:MAG: DNA-directed RNA polymerase subunit alpha, partial [Fibrobacterales bacterium]|nr:DNA-directed RNA polymerase subunit alpha [Fibrobacterales bacterium]